MPTTHTLHLPKIITIFSHEGDEGQRAFDVPLQETYTGTACVIPNSVANLSCAELGIDGLLVKLNDLFGTSYSLSSPIDEPVIEADADDDDDGWSDEDSDDVPFDTPFGLSHRASTPFSLLSRFVHQRADFGIAFAHLRPWWHLLSDPVHVERNMLVCEMDNSTLRDAALSQWSHQTAPTINLPDTPPRRVWDLYANRVVPLHLVSSIGARGEHPNGNCTSNITGISHSWARQDERTDVSTPINAYEWPVPIPADSSLERVRIELLNLGLEYVWLDVLCLRQASTNAVSEALRAEEWKLDVPTIGNVYRGAERVVHYYSGLGRPFRIGDMTDERHWLNRAWTLQEISPTSIVAGIAPDSPDAITLSPTSADVEMPDKDTNAFLTKLAALASFSTHAAHIFPVLEAMRHRAATSELDKISGLAYLLRSRRLPSYVVEEDTEAAWTRFLETISAAYLGDLLFLFPEPGAQQAKYRWAPSWARVKSVVSLPDCKSIELAEDVWYDSSWHIYRHKGRRIDDARIEGLDSPAKGEDRVGSMVVRDSTNREHRFTILAPHEHIIPDGQYVLHGSKDCQFWVVGKFGPVVPLTKEAGTIIKVSVVRLDKTSSEIVQMLGIAESKESGFM